MTLTRRVLFFFLEGRFFSTVWPLFARDLDRHHPRQTLSHIVGMHPGESAGALIDAEDSQLAAAFTGTKEEAAVGLDVEGPRRFFRRRLFQSCKLAGFFVDAEAGEAVVPGIGNPGAL